MERREMRRTVKDLFEQGDADNSGVMDKAEFEALVRRMNVEKTLPQNSFEGLDTDTAWEEMAKVPFQEGNQMGVNFHAFVCRIIF
jgi:Ca2+-binding EF-hand superfamily protein